MNKPKAVVLVASTSNDVARFIESRCQPIGNIHNVYLVPITQTISEFKKALESHAGGDANFCIFEVSKFEYSGDYGFLAGWLKEQLERKAEDQMPPSSKGTAPTERNPYVTQPIKRDRE